MNRPLVPLVLASLLVLAACGGGGGNSGGGQTTPLPPPPPSVQPPAIAYFGASPASITAGQVATLAWSASDASTLSIDPQVGDVSRVPTAVVCPAATTTYTLTATNSQQVSVKATVTVTVVPPATPAVLSVFAGIPSGEGTLDGTGTAARINMPNSLARDAAGNLYVTGAFTGLRKVTPQGEVTTLSVSPWGDNLPCVAADPAGTLYLLDMGGRILKRTADGTVTVLAGAAGEGAVDGPGDVARFNTPQGLACDAAGNLYVADMNNQTIRKVSPSGTVSTLAGQAGQLGTTDGTGAAARFTSPQALALDAAGNLYVYDHHGFHPRIRKVTPAGVVTTPALMPDQLGGLHQVIGKGGGVAVDAAGNVFAAHALACYICKITPAGAVSLFAGANGQLGNVDGAAAVARFASPAGLLLDGSGNLLVADQVNNNLRKVSPSGQVTTLAGGGAKTEGFREGQGPQARFSNPLGVATDAAGNLYVADAGNHAIRKITPAGQVSTLAGGGGGGSADGTGAAAKFIWPQGVALDGTGNVYVTDNGNQTIRKVTPAGQVTTLAGLAGQSGSDDGLGSAARFNLRAGAGIAVDREGNVHVADTVTIRKITPAGQVSTLAGSPASSGWVDGPGGAARFMAPHALAFDRDGNLLVADRYLRRVTPAGVVTTVRDAAGNPLEGDALAAAPDGAVYVGKRTDTCTTVNRVTPDGQVTLLVGPQGSPAVITGTVPAFNALIWDGLFGLALDPAGRTLYLAGPDAVLSAPVR